MVYVSMSMSMSMRMVFASSHILLYLVPLLGLAVVGQEEVELFNIHEPNSIAVSVGEEQLPVVASSVILAERWLRSHVLSHYPSSKITTIVVGKDVLCSAHHEHQWALVLPSVKNLHYSLVRWGLVREIKVSVVFSRDCLDHHSSSTTFRDDLAEIHLKPLLHFLQGSNSTYTINPRSQTSLLMYSHHQSALDKLGFSDLKMVVLKELERPTRSRKLITSFISSPYPEKPKPSNFQPHTPTPSPQSPSSQSAPSPDNTSPFSFIPSASPSEIPANPPDVFVYPPANPPDVLVYPQSPCPALPAATPTPAAAAGDEKDGLWCVAKPAVPAETLQKAIDYACGYGGADCEEILPHGDCYYPDNLVAHASYAFNSYWQKTKRNGGSCGFGGTAILIDSDPSFQHCRFELS